MDRHFAKQHSIPLRAKPHPLELEVIDGRPIASGPVTQETYPLEMEVNGHKESIVFNVTTTANPLATVTHACDTIDVDDYLEPFALPVVPEAVKTNAKPQKGNYGRIGRGGFWTVVVATLALVVGLLDEVLGSTIPSGIWTVTGLLFALGTLAVFVGFVLYGAASLQARVLPRWCGIVFIVGPSIFLLGALLGNSWEPFGGILFGLLWLALGYILLLQRETSLGQPSRVI